MRKFAVTLTTISLATWGAAVALGMPDASATSPGYGVFVGYADSLRPSAATFPNPFDTGPGVTNLGRASDAGNLDSGAVRLVNTTASAETVNSLVVHVGSTTYDIWPHGIVVGPFAQLVFDETSASNNFDSSDAPTETCTPDGIIPTVVATVDGVATTYNDTGQVLNTGGIDPPLCGGGNESQQWVSIGAPTCPTGAVLTLSPSAQTHPTFTFADVTANFSACGTPLQGATVHTLVTSGPNAGLHNDLLMTDAAGNAVFHYGSQFVGTDTVLAHVATAFGDIDSNAVTVNWIPPVGLDTTPSADTAVGGTLSDDAMLSNAVSPVGGAMNFTLYSDANCHTQVYSHSDPVTANGAYSSGSFTATTPGTYEWVVDYTGDGTNASVTSACGAEQTVVTPQLLTGRAYGISLGGLATLKPTPDTGPVATTSSTTVAPPCVVHIGTLFSPLKANAVCASVVTSAPYKSGSLGAASIAGASLSGLGLPAITIGAVQSASATTCAGSVGSTSIAYLKVGSTVLISGPTIRVRPNTTINLGILKIVLNQQIPITGAERGLTVNAIHITALNNSVNLVVASAESDIGNCP